MGNLSLNLKKRPRQISASSTTTPQEDHTNTMITHSAPSIGAGSTTAQSDNGSLTAQQRREALKLRFQRSFSEPLGGVAGRVLGVPCTPTVESPPSVSPSLHPSKRSRLSNINPQKLLSPPQSIEAGSISLPTSP